MDPSPELLSAIADRLTRPIPAPATPVARTKVSWRTLKLNQKLRLRQRWFRPGMDLPEGTEILITKVDSLGISLTHIAEKGTISTLRWTDPKWQGMFEKVARTRRKKNDTGTGG